MNDFQKQKILNQNGNNAFINSGTQIETQNINYSYNSFLPLKKYTKIPVKKIFFTNETKILNMIFFTLFLFIVSIFIYIKNKDWLLYILIWYGLFVFYSLSLIYFSIQNQRANLKIDSDKLILKSLKMKNNNYELKEINFIDIRSFLKEKDLLGHQFFIYKKNKINPYIKFSVSSIHTAIAIEELLKYNIGKAKVIN